MKVYLGGTCNGSTWRERLMPALKVSYFNPVVRDWNEEAQQREIEERRNCDCCLYVITPKMTGVYSVAEVVDDSNKRPRKTMLCVLNEDDGDRFSPSQNKSLEQVVNIVLKNRARVARDLMHVAGILNDPASYE